MKNIEHIRPYFGHRICFKTPIYSSLTFTSSQQEDNNTVIGKSNNSIVYGIILGPQGYIRCLGHHKDIKRGCIEGNRLSKTFRAFYKAHFPYIRLRSNTVCDMLIDKEKDTQPLRFRSDIKTHSTRFISFTAICPNDYTDKRISNITNESSDDLGQKRKRVEEHDVCEESEKKDDDNDDESFNVDASVQQHKRVKTSSPIDSTNEILKDLATITTKIEDTSEGATKEYMELVKKLATLPLYNSDQILHIIQTIKQLSVQQKKIRKSIVNLIKTFQLNR